MHSGRQDNFISQLYLICNTGATLYILDSTSLSTRTPLQVVSALPSIPRPNPLGHIKYQFILK